MEATTKNAKTTGAAAGAAPKARGGNDGKSPRALRGAPKASSSWTPAQEKAFAEMAKQREAFERERNESLALVASLFFKGVKPVVIEAVSDAEGKVLREAQTLPVALTHEQFVATLAENGDAVLTHLSKHFKLHPTLLNKTH